MARSLFTSLLLLIPGCSALFGSSANQEEQRYQERIAELALVADRVDGKARETIQAKVASAREAYGKLPKAGEERDKQLGLLNMRLAGDIEEARAGSARAHAPRIAALKPLLVGRWSGDGVRLDISPSFAVDYERKTLGFTKKFTGTLGRVDVDEFEAGEGGINTTFKLQKPPHQEGSTWKMRVDGVDLVRAP